MSDECEGYDYGGNLIFSLDPYLNLSHHRTLNRSLAHLTVSNFLIFLGYINSTGEMDLIDWDSSHILSLNRNVHKITTNFISGDLNYRFFSGQARTDDPVLQIYVSHTSSVLAELD